MKIPLTGGIAMDDQRPQSNYEPSVSYPSDSTFDSRGWRSFFTYRDLGVKASTGDDYDFRVVRAGSGNPVPTGWHYHILNAQIIYCLGGWEAIALEDGRVIKLVPGTCLNIPPGYVHNEIGYSPQMEMLVMTNPGTATTVGVDAPEGWDDDKVIAQVAAETAPHRLEQPWVWMDSVGASVPTVTAT